MSKPFVVLSVSPIPPGHVVSDADLAVRNEATSAAFKLALSEVSMGNFSSTPFLRKATMTTTQGYGGLLTDEEGNFLKAFGTPHRVEGDSHGWTFVTTEGKVFSLYSRIGMYRVFVKDCDIPDIGVMAMLLHVVKGGDVVLLEDNATC